jgi:hypothetical protein
MIMYKASKVIDGMLRNVEWQIGDQKLMVPTSWSIYIDILICMYVDI